jgi:hypothetical protein
MLWIGEENISLVKTTITLLYAVGGISIFMLIMELLYKLRLRK